MQNPNVCNKIGRKNKKTTEETVKPPQTLMALNKFFAYEFRWIISFHADKITVEENKRNLLSETRKEAKT